MIKPLFTVGHSNHSLDEFIGLLKINGVTAIGDVRSQPFSAYTPHFSGEALTVSLRQHGIHYVYIGNTLGGRSSNKTHYLNGRLQYVRLAKEATFDLGIDRVKQGMLQYQLALMCSEKDPIDCHRSLLIGRRLFEDGVNVQHILANTGLESHSILEERLLRQCNLANGDMFRSPRECIEDAYLIHSNRVAYADDNNNELAVRT